MKSNLTLHILLFIVCCFLAIGNIENVCHIYTNLGSDAQALLFWKYTSSIGLLPFREVFYPYGYLEYYLGQNLPLTILYLLISPSVFLAVFLALKNVFKNILFAIISFTIFYFFIVSLTGYEIFTRYGSLLAMVILFVYFFDKYKKKPRILIVALGVLSGIVFPLINDTSIYALLVYLVFTMVDALWSFQKKHTKLVLTKIIYESGLFILSYIFGFIPFVIYLYKTNSINGFIFYLNSLKQIALFAKTPYFHSIFTIDNIFTLSILLVTIVYVSLIFFINRKVITYNLLLQIGLVVIVLFLEQKSIIRSIDSQITFISLFLFFVLFQDLRITIRNIGLSDLKTLLYFANASVFILLILGLRSASQFTNQYPSFNQIYSLSLLGSNKSCVDLNIQFLSPKYSYINEVKNKLESLPNFNGKIYSFPSDPIFYLTLKQSPPFYPTLYESTPISAQEKIIHYIQTQKINYVLYNTNIKSIQDEVPDIVRGKLIYEYLNKNFSILTKVDGYEILSKNK